MQTFHLSSHLDDRHIYPQSIIELIIHERELQTELRLLNDNVRLTSFWSSLFTNAFLKPQVALVDDLLFFVHEYRGLKKKPEVKVFRTNSPNLPNPTDNLIDWEETVYLNLIMQYFTYVVTVAVYTRTGPQEWQILRKCSQTVYASPSCRKMQNKASPEEIDYPNIFFAIDNYEEIFTDCLVQDSECLGIELTAYDRSGHLHGVCFLGTITYETLKKIYDSQQKFKLWSHPVKKRSIDATNLCENIGKTKFMCVMGPQAKGSVELAITPVQQSGLLIKSHRPDDDYTDYSFLFSGCCQRITLSKSVAQLDSLDDWTVNRRQFMHNDDYYYYCDREMSNENLPTNQVVTTQPTVQSNLLYEKTSINCSDKNQCVNKLVDVNALNNIPTLYPTPSSIKSAGASVDTSPVRRFRFGKLRKSPLTTSQTESSPKHISSKLESVQSSNPDNRRASSKLHEILNTFTSFDNKSPSLIATNSELHSQNSTGAGQASKKNCYPLRPISGINSNEHLSESNKAGQCDSFSEANCVGIDSNKTSFRQSWSWFNERRRFTSIQLNACPTYISLPCQSILSDLLEVKREPILSFGIQH